MKIDINLIKENLDNPRTISGDKLELMKKSLTEFPEMLSIRPIILNSDYVINNTSEILVRHTFCIYFCEIN
jgi:hypothetical protein